MSALAEAILKYVAELPEGSIVSPKDFLHLHNRATIDQTFSRLTKQGKLIRIEQGSYVAPVQSRFGSRPPEPEKVLESLAQKSGQVMVSHGAAAANSLGLTTQVPVKEVFMTSGRSHQLKFGSRIIEIKHAPRWQTTLGNRPAGAMIRALSWLGQEHAPEAIPKLRERLSIEELKAVIASRSMLPSWMAKLISESLLGIVING